MAATGKEMRDGIVAGNRNLLVEEIDVLGGSLVIEHVVFPSEGRMSTVVHTTKPIVLSGAAYHFALDVWKPVFDAEDLVGAASSIQIEAHESLYAFHRTERGQARGTGRRDMLKETILKALVQNWPTLSVGDHALSQSLAVGAIARSLSAEFEDMRNGLHVPGADWLRYRLRNAESLHRNASSAWMSPVGQAYVLETFDGAPIRMDVEATPEEATTNVGGPATIEDHAGAYRGVVWPTIDHVVAAFDAASGSAPRRLDHDRAVLGMSTIGEIRLVLVNPSTLKTVHVVAEGPWRTDVLALEGVVSFRDLQAERRAEAAGHVELPRTEQESSAVH